MWLSRLSRYWVRSTRADRSSTPRFLLADPRLSSAPCRAGIGGLPVSVGCTKQNILHELVLGASGAIAVIRAGRRLAGSDLTLSSWLE